MGLFSKKLSSEELYQKAASSYRVGRYEEALPKMEKAAQKGHVKAQYYCGNMYDKGYGTPADKAKALMWFEKAAAQGDRLSQFYCGKMYEKGEGTPADLARARMWYEKAAAQGNDLAQAALERLNGQTSQAAPAPKAAAPTAEQLFREGLVAYQAKDYQKALPLFEKVAAQGNAAAQFNCGLMYDRGEGTPVDQARARMWYEKAAEQDHANSQHNCGNMYSTAWARRWIRPRHCTGTRKPPNRALPKRSSSAVYCTTAVMA